MTGFDALVDEAIDRIDDGIAENARDAAKQLVDEGLCAAAQQDALLHALEIGGYPIGADG